MYRYVPSWLNSNFIFCTRSNFIYFGTITIATKHYPEIDYFFHKISGYNNLYTMYDLYYHIFCLIKLLSSETIFFRVNHTETSWYFLIWSFIKYCPVQLNLITTDNTYFFRYIFPVNKFLDEMLMKLTSNHMYELCCKSY